jgi:N6-adenosine-specific RNA methylase IME4
MTKKYPIIYADPAWDFKNKNTGGSMKSGASAHYKTMTLQEMKELPVQDITEDNCVLFMWWVGSQPKEAIELAEAWGFTIKTMTGFVWIKLTKLLKLWFGMGHWTRAGSENCLIAVRGKPKRVSASVRSVIMARAGVHSEKPNEARKRIIQLCGDIPRLEMFARQRREGFDVWGNEVEGSIEL